MASKISCLPLGTLAILATALTACSRPSDMISGDNYTVTSDCTGVQEIGVTAYGGSIVSGTSWSSFGFPQNVVDLRSDVVGTAGTAIRVCSVTYGKDIQDPDEIIYSCYDNGSYACSILIRER